MKAITAPVDLARNIVGALVAPVVKAIQGIWTNQISELVEGEGITIDGDLTIEDDLDIAGAVGLAGNLDLEGTGQLYGHKNKVTTVTTNKTLTAADSGKIFLIGTNAKVFTLPATAAGLEFTFINIGADANNNIRIDPDDADKIAGLVIKPEGGNADATVDNTLVSVLNGADGLYIDNTQGTAQTGDRIKLVGDGNDGWFVAEGLGIWATE